MVSVDAVVEKMSYRAASVCAWRGTREDVRRWR